MTVAHRMSRLVEAQDTPLQPVRSSEELRADLAALDAERAGSTERLAALEKGRTAVLLTDDDTKAEAHDAEMRRVQRAIERADLKRPGLVEAIAAAEEVRDNKKGGYGAG